MGTRRLLIALLATLLCACGGGGGGYNSSPPPPAPPTGSTPPPVTIIDIAQPWAKATPADVNMDEVMLGRAASDAAAMPRFRSLLSRVTASSLPRIISEALTAPLCSICAR